MSTPIKTLGQALLPILDMVRSRGATLGLRPFTVTIHQITWSGNRVGDGIGTDVATQITNRGPDGVNYPVMVKQVSSQNAIASGGKYTNRDLRVGPITQPYGNGLGFDDTTIDPPGPVFPRQPVERIWVVNGPVGWGYAPDSCFEELGQEVTALHRYVILRATGRTL